MKLIIDTSKIHWLLVKRLKQDFVENEAGSDEYRETQPEKGWGMIEECFNMLFEDDDAVAIAVFACR